MKFTIDKELFNLVKENLQSSKRKNLMVSAIEIKGLNIENSKKQEVIDSTFQFLANVASKVNADLNKNRLNPEFGGAEWQDIFKIINPNSEKDEIFPSHINQQKRIFNNTFILDQISNITPLINILNAYSLKIGAPLGSHNIDNVKGDILVSKNNKDLEFTQMGKAISEKVNNDEIVYADDEKILTRNWVWKQCEQDKCTLESKNVFIPIDFITDQDITEIEKITEEIIKTIAGTIGFESAKFAIITQENNSVNFSEMNSIVINSENQIRLPLIKISRDEKIITRILNKAVEEIVPDKSKMEALLKSGLQIKLYQGFDPTAPTLHIGHTVMMRKLEDFRKIGHKVFMLIGDFTGRIGDPSDKKSARKKLTQEQVNENLKLYSEQASSILSIQDIENPIEVVFNNDWLGKMSFTDVVELASHFTVQQMLKRKMFQVRLEEDKPIFLHEFLYPLMQGYDSVHLDTDIELGGNDQLFNMLAGRVLQEEMNNRYKFVIAGKLLTTADGTKMGKSEGNMIMLSDNAKDIYGKVMAFTDNQIINGFEVLTSFELEEIKKFEDEMKAGRNPMELKKILAFTLVSELKGLEAAKEAQKFFEDIFQNKSLNEDIAVEHLAYENENINIIELLLLSKISKSKSDARRLVEQGAVKVNNQKILDWQEKVNLQKEGIIVRAGKQIKKVIK